MNPVQIIDGDSLQASMPGKLFRRGGFKLQLLACRSVLDSLADYLKQHPNRRVLITGYHTESEQATANVSNPGVIRANEIAAYLRRTGVSDSAFVTRGMASEALRFADDSTNALAFGFEPRPAIVRTPAEQQKYTDLFHSLALYFPAGSSAYIQTPDNSHFVRDAVVYLKEHHGARLVISGHTDSIGTVARNVRLSLKRAGAIAEAFKKAGIRSTQMKLVAMGESQPIAPNATVTGREANRRVTVQVERK